MVRITLAGGEAIELSRMGVMRTQLLAELRDGRGDDAAAAAGAVGEAAVFSAVSGGEPATVLDGIHPGLAGTLVQLATLPARRDAIADLGRRTELAVGFRQLASVRRPAAGTTPCMTTP